MVRTLVLFFTAHTRILRLYGAEDLLEYTRSTFLFLSVRIKDLPLLLVSARILSSKVGRLCERNEL